MQEPPPNSDHTETRDTVNRRSCLKSTIAAGSAFVPAALASKAFAAGSDEVKVGLIGCGGRGSGAAAQAMSTGRTSNCMRWPTHLADRLENSLSSLSRGKAGVSKVAKGEGFGGAMDVPPERRFVGLDAYRRMMDSDIDLAILTGPPGYRPLHFERAIEADKHVFMEKPLASDAAGVRRILAANETGERKESESRRWIAATSSGDLLGSDSTNSQRRDRSYRLHAMLLERGPTGKDCLASRRQNGAGIPGPQLVLLRLAQRRSHL